MEFIDPIDNKDSIHKNLMINMKEKLRDFKLKEILK